MPKSAPSARQSLVRPENRHWLLAIYWPFYTLAYVGLNRLGGRAAPVATACALDALIPFDARFIVPYLLWFPLWIGLLAYGALREPRMFRRMMRYLMLTFTTAVALFWLFPTSGGLRPDPVPGDGPCAALTRLVYRMDADANACPSEHIIGLFAAVFAVWDSKRLSRPVWKALVVLCALVIGASTVLVKQHGVIDLAAGAAVSVVGGCVCYRRPRVC